MDNLVLDSSQYETAKGFEFDKDRLSLTIRVSKATILCSVLKVAIPMLAGFILVGLILALTEVINWGIFYFILGIIGFTAICVVLAPVLNKYNSYYFVTRAGVVRSVTGMTRQSLYGNIKSIKKRSALFFKDGGTINFKLYKGSGINLQFYMLKGLNQTYELINYFLEFNKSVAEFNKLVPEDYWSKCETYVCADSENFNKLPQCLKVYYVMYGLHLTMEESGFFENFIVNEYQISPQMLVEVCELFNLPELTDLCRRAIELYKERCINKVLDAKDNDYPDENIFEELDNEYHFLDEKFDFETLIKAYYVRHYEKFDFE